MTLPRVPTSLILIAAPVAWACGSEPATEEKKAPLAVQANPPGHTFEGKATIELTSSRPAHIFYTLNGEDPIGADALEYTGPIELEASTLVTFLAVSDDGIWSSPAAELYTPAPVQEVARELVPRALRVDRDNHFFTGLPGQEERMTATFTVRSIGLDRVHISNIYIGTNPKGWGFFEDGIFRIEGPALEGFDLAPGAEHEIVVSYQPTLTLRSAVLVIESDEQRSSDGYLLVELWGRVINW